LVKNNDHAKFINENLLCHTRSPEPHDLYEVKFFRYDKLNLRVIAEYEDVYADQLCNLIESETGLFLGPMRIQIAEQYARV
jgi:hypothetical protein